MAFDLFAVFSDTLAHSASNLLVLCVSRMMIAARTRNAVAWRVAVLSDIWPQMRTTLAMRCDTGYYKSSVGEQTCSIAAAGTQTTNGEGASVSTAATQATNCPPGFYGSGGAASVLEPRAFLGRC